MKACASYADVFADKVGTSALYTTTRCTKSLLYAGCGCRLYRYIPIPVGEQVSSHKVLILGTPHTLHYENATDALNAGKHVLCEKATTSNASELKVLLQLAKEKKLFFMEALWTRFHPLTLAFKKIAEEGTLGDPVVLHADLSADFHTESMCCTSAFPC